MNTPLQAVLWELWRTSRVELLGRTSFFSLMAIWVSAAWTADSTAELHDVLRGIVLIMLSFGSVFSVTWMSALDNRTIGFCFPLAFARPVSSAQLTLVPMFFSMVAAVVTFLVPIGVFSFLRSSTFPLLGLSAGIACAVACFMATAWSPTTNIGRWLSVIAVSIGFIALFTVFHVRRNETDPWLLVMGRPDYFQFAWYYYAICVVVSVIAGAIAVIGVDRQRHGDKWQFFEAAIRLLRMPDRSEQRSLSTSEPFRSEFAAQYWCEMRRVGRVVLPCAICVPLLPLAWVVSAPLFAEKAAIWRDTPTIWLVALILCPLVYQAFGAEAAVGLKRRQGATWLSAFDATSPMASDQLTAVKLIALSVCSLVGWLCMLLVAGLHSALIGNWEVWAQIARQASAVVGDVSAASWFAGLAALALLFISSTSMVLSFALWVARHEVQLFAIVTVGMCEGALALASHFFKWDLTAYWQVSGYAVAVGIGLVSGLVLRRAYAAGYFSKPLLQLTQGLWAIYVVSAIAFYVHAAPGIISRFEIPLPVLAIAASTLIVPLAATAAAPVALDSNRHC